MGLMLNALVMAAFATLTYVPGATALFEYGPAGRVLQETNQDDVNSTTFEPGAPVIVFVGQTIYVIAPEGFTAVTWCLERDALIVKVAAASISRDPKDVSVDCISFGNDAELFQGMSQKVRYVELNIRVAVGTSTVPAEIEELREEAEDVKQNLLDLTEIALSQEFETQFKETVDVVLVSSPAVGAEDASQKEPTKNVYGWFQIFWTADTGDLDLNSLEGLETMAAYVAEVLKIDASGVWTSSTELPSARASSPKRYQVDWVAKTTEPEKVILNSERLSTPEATELLRKQVEASDLVTSDMQLVHQEKAIVVETKTPSTTTTGLEEVLEDASRGPAAAIAMLATLVFYFVMN